MLFLKIFYSALILFISGQILTQIPIDGLVANYTFSGNVIDSTDNKNNGILVARFTNDRFGNPASAIKFNGINEYVEFADIDDLSISETGDLSVSVWIKCSTLDFNFTQSNGYVHWMGKGYSGQHEWVFRIYNKTSIRPNRISCYAFNLKGGHGSGSYSQEQINVDDWMHFVGIYNVQDNLIQLYKNGLLSDTDHFSDNEIQPRNGKAKFRIGTRDFKSFFKGAIDDLRIYNRVLSVSEISEMFHERGWNIKSKNNLLLNKSINILPNPASNKLFINLTGFSSSNDYKIKIINTKGQTVLNYSLSTDTQEIYIDTNTLNGIYFVQLIGKNNIPLISKRIIFN